MYRVPRQVRHSQDDRERFSFDLVAGYSERGCYYRSAWYLRVTLLWPWGIQP